MFKENNQQLNDILEVLEQFAIGNYQYHNISYQEGINSKIHNRLEKLGDCIALNIERLYLEKEETKALITDISHQLKTPLAALKTSHAILEEEGLTERERKEFVERIGGQIKYLESLTAALVNISRMETGLIFIQKEQADIAETIVSAVGNVYTKAESKNIQIESEQLESVILDHDPRWTREAITNILDNAIKYSPADSKIMIRLEKASFFLRIEIHDEGIGIPKEEFGEVFQRFFRGKSSLVKETEGIGVGLYLSRKIIEEQSGNIIAVSSKKGISGSVFIIQLPL